MNCREFLVEFEERNVLTKTAALHLNDCPGCKKMSGEQTRVWQMIDGLNEVNAPKDFDFRVKARIANARPSDFQPNFFPVLRYVLPLGIIVLLAGFIALNSTYFSDASAGGQMATVTNTTTAPTSVTEEKTLTNSVPESMAVAAPINNQALPVERPEQSKLATDKKPLEIKRETKFVAVKSPGSQPSEPLKTPLKDKFEGSRTFEGSTTRTFRSAPVFTPKDFSPNQKVEIAPDSENKSPFSIEQIGSLLGIEIVTENGKRKVKSVVKNSSAARSGVKVGDVIEELNGKKLSDESLRSKTIGAKTLTVIRGSEKIVIALQN